MQTEVQHDILLRLRRIEGQVRGVQRMIEAEEECSQILNQVSAIKSAMNQVGILIFNNHAKDCINRSLLEPDGEERFDEIIKMMGRLMK